MSFDSIAEFDKDLKRLLKKYRSLKEDLETFKSVAVFIDVDSNNKFSVLYRNEHLMIIKARFFCKYLKGKTLRIVYAKHATENKIVFIELFFKGDKEREDGGRIKNYLSGWGQF